MPTLRLLMGLAFALTVSAPLASGCGNGITQDRACTEIGCNNGLSWSFSRPLRDAGAYVVQLDLDGTKVSCQTSVPFAGCASGSACNSTQVVLEQSGCALPASEHSIGGVHILSSPARARITIQRDGALLVSQEITPTYVRSQPNGEGCPPACEQASATLTMP